MQAVRAKVDGWWMAAILLAMLALASACAGSDTVTDGDIEPDGDMNDGDDSDGDSDDADGDADSESEDGDIVDGDTTETDSDVIDGDVVDGDTESTSPVRIYRLETVPDQPWPDAVSMPGDYVLENELVRVVIQAPNNPPRSWVPNTASIIDADIVRPAGEPLADALGEITPMPSLLRAFCPTNTEIVNDGAAGDEMVLRFTGHDCGIEIVDMVLLMPNLNLDVVLEYRLKAGERAVNIVTTITNPGSGRSISVGDGIVWSNRAHVLTPGLGWGLAGLTSLGDFPYQIAMNDRVAYALVSDTGMLKVSLDQAYILPFMGVTERVATGKSLSYSRWLAIGATAEDLHEYLATRDEQLAPRHEVAVTLTGDVAGALNAKAWLVVRKDGEPLTALPVNADILSFKLPDGDYELVIEQEGRPEAPQSLTVSGADQSINVEIPQTGLLSITIGETDGTDNLPCRVSLHPVGAPGQILKLFYSPDGRGEWLVEPGDYLVVISRGFEYSILSQTETVSAGQTTTIEGALAHVVDTDGWLMADTHMHSERSIDAGVAVEDRVTQFAALGLEFTPGTDHDVITDYEPIIENLGLSDWVRTVPGVEVSPPWAHTNAYPVVDDPERPMYFGLPFNNGYDDAGNFLGYSELPAIWDFARTHYQAGIIQINHPRDGSGYFNGIDFDPETGVAGVDPERFDGSADAVELINSGDINTSMNQVLIDWFSLLNEGYPIAGVSTSDSHTSGNPGECRSWVFVDADAPRDIEVSDWVSAIKGQRVVTGCGPFVTATIGDTQVGQTATGAGPHTLAIRAQAPGWMPVDWVRVIVNGAVVDQINLDPRDGAPLDFSTDFILPQQTGDYWVVVLAGAPDKTMAPVYPATRVMGITNPIYVDQDDDGYTAPGFPLVRETEKR
jgi:hypothetical protein